MPQPSHGRKVCKGGGSRTTKHHPKNLETALREPIRSCCPLQSLALVRPASYQPSTGLPDKLSDSGAPLSQLACSGGGQRLVTSSPSNSNRSGRRGHGGMTPRRFRPAYPTGYRVFFLYTESFSALVGAFFGSTPTRLFPQEPRSRFLSSPSYTYSLP